MKATDFFQKENDRASAKRPYLRRLGVLMLAVTALSMLTACPDKDRNNQPVAIAPPPPMPPGPGGPGGCMGPQCYQSQGMMPLMSAIGSDYSGTIFLELNLYGSQQTISQFGGQFFSEQYSGPALAEGVLTVTPQFSQNNSVTCAIPPGQYYVVSQQQGMFSQMMFQFQMIDQNTGIQVVLPNNGLRVSQSPRIGPDGFGYNFLMQNYMQVGVGGMGCQVMLN